MEKRVRMVDIAEKMGVSTFTVSKALSGKDGVSEEMREEVRRVAEEMGYQTKSKSKIESASKGMKFGILTRSKYIEQGQSFYWSLYERMLYHLNAGGHIGILEFISEEIETKLLLPKFIQTEIINGLILMGKFSKKYRNMLTEAKIPFVCLDMFDEECRQDTVISDGYYGMYFVTRHLLQMGHRDIVFLGRVGATYSITDRYFGFCKAMQEAGLQVTPEMVLPDRDENDMLQISIEQLHHMPTAFACNCDNSAYYLMQKLQAKGYRIPDDISIVGFDNYILSEMTTPKMTTYEVNLDKMALASIQQLQQRLAEPERPWEQLIISGHFIQRDSVKKIN
ncbi:MAG: LacI family DNA-binding transcriptional regulator [Oscillospiraceae bacterium]|nr:LacI family DNA-binding transcriptional regulator [Oscillospiraceae bacterium]